MAVSRKRLIVITALTLVVVLIGVVGVILYDRLTHLGDLREMASQRLEDLTGHKVTIGSADLDFSKGIGISLQDVAIGVSYESKPKLKIDRTWVAIKVLPLLKKRIEIQRVVVQGIALHVIRDEKGRLSVGDIQTLVDRPVPEDDLFQFFKIGLVRHLVVRGGSIHFVDKSQGTEPVSLSLENINLTVRKRFLETPFNFHVQGQIPNPKKDPTEMEVSGNFDSPLNATDISKLEVNGKIQIENLRLSGFHPYLKKLIPLMPKNTRVSIDSSFSGNLGDKLHTLGEIQYASEQKRKGPFLRDPAVPHHGIINYKVALQRNAVEFEDVQMKSGPFHFQARGNLEKLFSGDPSVSFHLETGEFQVQKSQDYLPLMIFSEEMHRKFQSRYGQGSIALKSIDFKGQLTQLHNLAEEENFKLLSTKIFLKRVDWLDPLPPLKKVTGLITTESGDSKISLQQAVFEGFPLTNIHGTIKDLLYRPVADLSVENRVEMAPFHKMLIRAIDDDSVREYLRSFDEFEGQGLVRFSLKGPLSEPENIRLAGTLSMEDVSLYDKDLAHRIENMKGRILYRSPITGEKKEPDPWIWIVQFKDFSGTFGNSSFENLMGDFGLENGVPVKNTTATYRLESRELQHLVFAEPSEDFLYTTFNGWDFSGGSVEMDYHSQEFPENPEKNREWGNIELMELSMRYKDPYQPVLNLTGDIEFGEQGYRLRKVAGWYGDSQVQLEGVVHPTPETNPNFSLNVTSPDFLFSDLKNVSLVENLQLTGSTRLTMQLDGTPRAFKFKNHADLAQSDYRIGDFLKKSKGFKNTLDLRGTYLEKKGLSLEKLVYSLGGNTVTGRATIKDLKDPRFSLALDAREFKTFPVAHVVSFLESNQEGTANFEIRMDGNLNSLDTIQYEGTASLGDLRFQPENLPSSLVFSANVKFADGKFNFDEGKLASDLTNVEFSGYYKQDDKPTVDLKVSGEALIVDEFLPGSGEGGRSFSEFLDSYELLSKGASRISLDLDRLDCRFLKLNAVSGGLFLANKNLKVNELKIGKENPILVKGVLAMDEPETAELKGRLRAEGIRAERVTGLFGDMFQNGLTGTMKNLDIQFIGRGENRVKLVKSMKAKVEVGLYDGEISTNRLKKGALELFGLGGPKSVESKKETTDGSKEFTHFRQISGLFSLQKGILQTEDFIYEDESRKSSIVGKFDLYKYEMDTVVGVAPMADLDKFLTKIPVVGKIITGGDEKSLVKSYYLAKGKFDDPEITMVPFTSLTKKVMGIFQAILQTPVDILIPDNNETKGK
jgi:hypothetical protein